MSTKLSGLLIVSLAAGAVAASVGIAGCATTQMAGDRADDRWLTTKVATKLAADPDIRKFDIDVDTVDNVVTLRGNASNAAARTEAGQIARDTDGVVRVENRLVVGKDDDLFDGHADFLTTARVRRKLRRDPEVKARNVDVDTDDGIVTLSGLVESMRAVHAAQDTAARTEGVIEVRNELEVGYLPNPHASR